MLLYSHHQQFSLGTWVVDHALRRTEQSVNLCIICITWDCIILDLEIQGYKVRYIYQHAFLKKINVERIRMIFLKLNTSGII